MWTNDIKCKYMFIFPLQNLARKELIYYNVLESYLFQTIRRTFRGSLTVFQYVWRASIPNWPNQKSVRMKVMHTRTHFLFWSFSSLSVDIKSLSLQRRRTSLLQNPSPRRSIYSHKLFLCHLFARHSRCIPRGTFRPFTLISRRALPQQTTPRVEWRIPRATPRHEPPLCDMDFLPISAVFL